MKKVKHTLKTMGVVLGVTILMLVLISGITAVASTIMNNTKAPIHKHATASADTTSKEWVAIDYIGLKN